MNSISLRSPLVLSILGVLAISFLFIAEQTKREIETEWFDEKLEASRLSETAQKHLKQLRLGEAVFTNNLNDPNETGLIGQEFSLISTGRGSLPVKASTVNANFAGLILQLLKEAKVQKGDKVALCATGSFPALNISTMAALQTLGAEPLLISSVTSSTWGATDPEFTWLDMEHALVRRGIFKHHSLAASIGGNDDIGRTLSQEGRQLAMDAVFRNELAIINTDSLAGNIGLRMKFFREASLSKPIKAFINIGGGIASLGSRRNGMAISSGLHQDLKQADFPDKLGVMYQMVQEKVPVIHLQNLSPLMNRYALPYEPIPLPPLGEGNLYKSLRYNVWIVFGCTAVLMALISAIVIQDRKRDELGTQVIEPKNN